jgi:peptide/nickel transport system permease protein
MSPVDLPTASLDAAEEAPARAEWRETLRALLRSKTFVVGLAIVLFWTLAAVFWPWLVPFDPQKTNAANTFQPPSWVHWFGTDDFGRDVLSRVLAGAAPVLATAPAATALGILGGLLLGMTAALMGGWVDAAIMRLVDALLAFPLLIFAIAILGVIGGSALNVILVIGLAFSPNVARTIRGVVLEEKEKEYVAAARLLGNRLPTIAVREILPNIVPIITVEATVRLGYAIFASATLSFLALGLQQPSPDWGLTIALGRGYVQYAAWMVLFPAAALATLVVGANLMADGVRDVLEE